ncbi:MAG: UDP-N-acetylglucosamine 2-epimerase (non-hydrolyzing) [Verrucomicrobiales bacterium]|nr:UDP-N-acetylglucosamine 2-epimerase (non-hydrolyzing) [Verrucomicrobiales bacterium]
MKILTILGTRPEIIRLSRVIASLDEVFDHVLVHTGQNSDFRLSEVFFQDLGVREPDYFLEIDRSSPGRIIGEVLIETEKVLLKERPDAVLILGDTNSALSAIIARRLKIPIFHMEAGNRCFDPNVPEEMNRRIVDHSSDVNLVYTEHARRNLLAEGIHPRSIYLTGSPMREVLDFNRAKFKASAVLNELKLERGNYFLASIHRAENVDSEGKLVGLLETFDLLSEEYGIPVIVSMHPRTRERVEKLNGWRAKGDVRFLEPFGFHDYIALQLNARCTLSDSGTVSEEAAILGFPAVTLRHSIERPEAMDTGHIVVTGLNREIIFDAVKLVTSRLWKDSGNVPPEYEVTNTSERVVKLILGTAKLCHEWQGVNFE